MFFRRRSVDEPYLSCCSSSCSSSFRPASACRFREPHVSTSPRSRPSTAIADHVPERSTVPGRWSPQCGADSHYHTVKSILPGQSIALYPVHSLARGCTKRDIANGVKTVRRIHKCIQSSRMGTCSKVTPGWSFSFPSGSGAQRADSPAAASKWSVSILPEWHTLVDCFLYVRSCSPTSLFAATTRFTFKSWVKCSRLPCRDRISRTISIQHTRQRNCRNPNRQCACYPASSISSSLDDVWLRIRGYTMAVSYPTTATATSSEPCCAFVFEHCHWPDRRYNDHAFRSQSREIGGLPSTRYFYGLDTTRPRRVTLFGRASKYRRSGLMAAIVQESCICERDRSWRRLFKNE